MPHTRGAPEAPPPDEVEPVDPEVIEHDAELHDDVRNFKRRATEAAARSGEAISALNQWRWEMTVCPFGPRYSQQVYADAVGQSDSTIDRGARSWQAHLDSLPSESPRDGVIHSSGCSLGGEPHNAREVPPPLTDAEVQSAERARRRVDATRLRAIIIEALARHWTVNNRSVVFTTIEVNYRALVNEALTRFNAGHDASSMTEAQVVMAADALALAMHLEHQLREMRTAAVGRWMKVNRASETNVPIADVRRMVDRIERRMESREWTWEQSEADARDWDWRRCEVERENNEMVKRARLAVLDLRQAAAQVKAGAVKLGRAMQRIQTDDVPISADELTLVEQDLADAEGLVAQCRAAVRPGSSGIDWDEALAGLTGGTS
jgi:hypothetical protein